MYPALIRRMAAYGSGFNPLGRISDEGLARSPTVCGPPAATRPSSRWSAGLRGAFPDDESTADLAEAVEDAVPRQLARGFTSFCFKPNQFIDDVDDWGELCREAVARSPRRPTETAGWRRRRAALAATGASA